MRTYFPFLRGKQNEMIALRSLADRIASSGIVYPIIEPVNANATTVRSFERFVDAGMPFVLVTNPMYGAFKGSEEGLYATFMLEGPLADYDNFIPALYINRETSITQVRAFNENYANSFRGVIYTGEPTDGAVRDWCSTEDRIYFHIIQDGKVPSGFVRSIPTARQVVLRDTFNRQERNKDYPETEFFTDQHTAEGNPDGSNWGDYSIQGDYYSEDGGPAMAVALHHIHRSEDGDSLSVSHYLSDRQDTTADVQGKTMEAVDKLVADLDNLVPNDTEVCDLYRGMARSRNPGALGYMKRLAIQHHLEVMVNL